MPAAGRDPSSENLAGEPGQVVARQLGAVITMTLESPGVRARLEGAGFEIGAASQETFADSIARGFRVYQQIVNDAGIRPE